MKNLYFVWYSIIILGSLVTYSNQAMSQTIPVGMPILDDYYRREQLLGNVDSNWSFSVRPLFPNAKRENKNIFDPDSTLHSQGKPWVSAGPVSFAGGHGMFQVLPVSIQQQFNSSHPYGWNDGAMIPARGYQTLISGGFFLKLGPLSVQLKPEFVYAQNKNFDGFASGHNEQDIAYYYQLHNQIDLPQRFGNAPYKKAFWGQSSVRLTAGPVSAGVSNENIWWGPGIYNSLIFTNNAPGFEHITINTTRPVRTPIGSFEGQLLAGKLIYSGYNALPVTTVSNGTYLPVSRRQDWRYFTGVNLNYHPSFIPGFTLGFIRSFNAYHQDVKSAGFKAYFPFFISYQKKVSGIDGDPFPRDQLTSLYGRWVFTKANAELYFEYGIGDNSYNYRDLIGSPEHSRAYVFGLRKLLPFAGEANQHILVGAEVTQTSQNIDKTIRETGLWYYNYQLLEGHTHQGQVLGAGTGPGNLQTIELSWISGLKKLGLLFNRVEYDVDYQQTFLPAINGNSRKWVDIALGLQGEWNYRNLLLNARIQGVRSFNYQWILKNYNPADIYYVPNNDVFNLQAQLGVTFRF